MFEVTLDYMVSEGKLGYMRPVFKKIKNKKL